MIAERLLAQRLVRDCLRHVEIAEHEAQRASDQLTALPDCPVLDDDIETMFISRIRLYHWMREADRRRKPLTKIVQFYLSTY